MIRPLAALTRQVQDFFHSQLLGLYRWEQVEFSPRQKALSEPPRRNSRGRMVRPDRHEGKYQCILDLRFGVFDLSVEGVNERPPLGWARLVDGSADGGVVEGPLDATTWKRFGDYIKKYHMEIEHGDEHSTGNAA